jgi:hypothetical protein
MSKGRKASIPRDESTHLRIRIIGEPSLGVNSQEGVPVPMKLIRFRNVGRNFSKELSRQLKLVAIQELYRRVNGY